MEINLIIFNSILIVLLFLCLIIINGENSSFYLFIFVIMFIISIINLIFSSILRHWRRINIIKTDRKVKGTSLALAGFILTVVLYAFCLIEEKIFIKVYSLKEILVLYITYFIIEIFSIMQLYIWLILRTRIKDELDEAPSIRNKYSNNG